MNKDTNYMHLLTCGVSPFWCIRNVAIKYDYLRLCTLRNSLLSISSIDYLGTGEANMDSTWICNHKVAKAEIEPGWQKHSPVKRKSPIAGLGYIHLYVFSLVLYKDFFLAILLDSTRRNATKTPRTARVKIGVSDFWTRHSVIDTFGRMICQEKTPT